MTPPRRIVIVAAPSLRAALIEQLALCPDFELAEAESLEECGGFDILLLDAELGLALAARERFCGRILLIGSPAQDALPASIERIARPLRFGDLLLQLRAAGRGPAQDVRIGPFRFRPGAVELVDAAGRRLPLTEKEAEILARLVAADGETVTKEILLRDIWGYRPAVTTRTLETHVSRLRRKIETAPADSRLLLTEKNGYRLVFRREGGTPDGNRKGA